MNTDTLSRLTAPHAGWTWGLTILSCLLVSVSAVTGHVVILTLLAVMVPLAMAAAIQTTAVAPLAAEVLRLREELGRTPPARA